MSDEMKMAFFCVIFVSMGCGIMSPIVPGNNENTGTAADCHDACENLERLECDGWNGSPGSDEIFGTKDDIPCEDVCRAIMSEPTATLFPICTASAKNCDSVYKCFE